MTPLLVDKEEVVRLVGLSKATIDRREAEGKFPRRLRVGGKVLWKYDDLLQWSSGLAVGA